MNSCSTAKIMSNDFASVSLLHTKGNVLYDWLFRSSFKIVVFKNFAIFIGKHQCWILISILEHVYMRPEVSSNWFEISLWDKIPLWCEVTSLSAFTWIRAEWNSLRSNWSKWNFKPEWVFHVNIKFPQWNKVAQNH